MISTIITLFVITSLVMAVFIVVNPRATPILVGQQWNMPGIGIVTVTKVLDSITSFEKMSAPSVMYKLEDSTYGLCKKSDLRNFGRLLPRSREMIKDTAGDRARVFKESGGPKIDPPVYHPPGSSKVQDAEVVEEGNGIGSKAIRQYKRMMSYDRRYPKD